jgi:hypothetical protein
MAAKTSSSGRHPGQLIEADHPCLSNKILGQEAFWMVDRELHPLVTTGIPSLYYAQGPLDTRGPDRHFEAGGSAAYLDRHLNHLRSLLYLPDSGFDYFALHFEGDSNREEPPRPKV